jgi:hypothetical protein
MNLSQQLSIVIFNKQSIGPPVNWPNGQLAENWPKMGKNNFSQILFVGASSGP